MTKDTGTLRGGILAPRHVRMLKISVAIMTALLFLGTLALVYGVVRQASKLGTAARPPAADRPAYFRPLDLGQGKLESVGTSGDYLILYWKGERSDTVVTLNLKNGHELGRVQVPRR